MGKLDCETFGIEILCGKLDCEILGIEILFGKLGCETFDIEILGCETFDIEIMGCEAYCIEILFGKLDWVTFAFDIVFAHGNCIGLAFEIALGLDNGVTLAFEITLDNWVTFVTEGTGKDFDFDEIDKPGCFAWKSSTCLSVTVLLTRRLWTEMPPGSLACTFFAKILPGCFPSSSSSFLIAVLKFPALAINSALCFVLM